MDRVRYKEVKIEDLFDFKRGKVISKQYIDENKGDYPVYSSQTQNDGILGYINTFMFEGECLTWTTDGINAGTVFHRRGKFNCTNVCGIMIPKNHNLFISLDYVKNSLNLKNIAKGVANKKVMTNDILNAKLIIKIPINPDGSFNLEKQKEIAKKYEILERYRKEMEKKKRELEEVSVEILREYEGREMRIDEVFESKSGNSKITQSYINKNKGEFPVYSAKTTGDAIFGKISHYMFNIEGLQLITNGNAGTIIYREKHKFSLNGDARMYFVKNKYNEHINIKFLKIIIELSFQSLNFSWVNKAGKNKVNNILIKIPTHPDGSFDLEKQKEIAKKYEKVEEVKKRVIGELDRLIRQEVGMV